MANSGTSSTRGISFDLTPRRAAEALHLSTGQRTPRRIANATDGGVVQTTVENFVQTAC